MLPPPTTVCADGLADSEKSGVGAAPVQLVIRSGKELAMAHGQLGHKQEARRWYDKSADWIEKNMETVQKQRHNRLGDDLSNIRAEAAKLLGVEEKK